MFIISFLFVRVGLSGGHLAHDLALERLSLGLLVAVDRRAQAIQNALRLVEVDGVQ